MVNRNIGIRSRAFRGILGLVMVGGYFIGGITGPLEVTLAILGAYLLITAITGNDPLLQMIVTSPSRSPLPKEKETEKDQK